MIARKIAFVFLLFIMTIPAFSQTEKVLDRVIAIIGNEIITESELQLQLIQAGAKSRIDVNDPLMRKRVLEAMMNDKLVLAQAVLDSINVTEDEVTRRLDSQIDYLKKNYGSVERLEQAAGMPISQMKREFREDIRKRMMIDQVQQARFSDISVNQREVNDFYQSFKDSLPPVPEQVELRQIVIFPRVTDNFKLNARNKALALIDSLKKGADFSDLAKKYSDDIGSAKNGGALGLARRGVFVKEFEEAAFALKPGEVSGVVETPFGFHIIKLIERKGEAITPQHILIRVAKTGESDSAAILLLADLRKRILGGESFTDLARKYSEDEDSRKAGGSLGLIEVPQLSDDQKTIQQTLSPGEISLPRKVTLEKDYGYSIVQLSKRVTTHPPNLADDFVRITGYAKIFKQNNEYNKWIEEIKKNVYWKVMI
jgi:peptidyl-prolyl cis-trans isomerase SurA